jgi:hypothetical protein
MESEGEGIRFMDERSILLKGASQLEECGFMVRPPSFVEFVKVSSTQGR